MRGLILVLAILLPALGYSQAKLSKNFKVELGSPYPVVDADYKYQFVQNGELMMVKIEDENVKIQKLNVETLKFIAMKEYEDFHKDYAFLDIEKVEDRYYFFYTHWDKANKNSRLYSREIDFASGTFVNKGKLIVTVDGGCSFHISHSLNSSKFMVRYRKAPLKRNDSKNFDIIGTHIFDFDGTKLYSGESRLPYTEEQMDNLDFDMDWKGNAYVLARVKVRNEKGKFTNEGSHLELLLLPGESNDEVRKTKISLDNKFISDAWLFENVYGEIICGGFYNNKKQSSVAHGLFFSHIDSDGELLSTRFYDIPLDIINQNEKGSTQAKNAKKERKGKEIGLYHYDIKEIRINSDDGSFLVISERDYIVSKTNTKTGTTTYTYFYEDVLLTKISEEGELRWMKKLPKIQVGKKGRGGMSYKYMNSDTHHYIVFLDNVKNLELDYMDVPSKHQDGAGGFLMAYRIDDKTGDVSKDAIFDVRDVKGTEVYQFSVNRIIMLNNSEFVVEVYKKKKEDILIKVRALD